MKDALEHPRLLPGILVPDPDADHTRRSTRDWIVDVACFLIAVVGGLAVFAEAEPRMSEGLIVADLLLGVPSWFAIWWRRRWPVQLAIGLGLVSVVSTSASLAALIALFTLVVHRRAGIALPLAALTLPLAPAIEADTENVFKASTTSATPTGQRRRHQSVSEARAPPTRS